MGIGAARGRGRADGRVAVPGSDCHTHSAFVATASRSSRCASGASYEELHAAGAGILSTVRRRAGREGASLPRSSATAAGCCARHDDVRGGRATARPRPSSRSCGRSAAGAVPTFLGAHAVRPSTMTQTRTRLAPKCARRSAARRGCRRLPRARSRAQAAATRSCRDAGLALRLHGDQFTEAGAIALAVELGARSVDHLEATGPDGVRTLAASGVVGVLLPASALVLGRPMPPGRALVDSGAAIALATDFNPGSSFCESLPLVCSLAATQLRLSPAEALAACTVNAAHVLARADRIGRLAPGFDADVTLLGAPDWRYLATTRRRGRRRVVEAARSHGCPLY